MWIDLISQPRCSLHPAAHKRDKIVSFWDICALHRDDFPPRAAPGELKVQIPAPPGIRALPCCNSLAKKHQKRTFLPLFRCCLFCLRQWEGEEEKKKKIRSKIKLCQGCRKGKVQGTRSQPGPSSSFTRVGIPAGHRASCRPPGARRAQGGKGHGDTACGLCTGCGDTLYRL